MRCEHCGDVIGVYEPLVVRSHGEARESSRAAEPDLPADGHYFHGACYAEVKQRGEV
jgi:hypothetical protein